MKSLSHRVGLRTDALNLASKASNTCGGNGEEQARMNRAWNRGDPESKTLCEVDNPLYHVAGYVVKSVQNDGAIQLFSVCEP